jgi:REP element-mobilizing transposase RayT
VDHRHAYATLACSARHSRDWLSVSGRFKSFPVQTDEHFLTVARYVERNALWAKLVKQAENWRWSSLWRRDQEDAKLAAWLSA